MELKLVTRASFDQLDQAEWFSKVGCHGSHLVSYAGSWNEAIIQATSLAWENVRLEASNRLRRDIAALAPARYLDWNKVAAMVRRFSIPWVKGKIRAVQAAMNFPKEFEDVVQWDMAGLGLEVEYSDVVGRGFYVGLAHFYMVGHFPCGWEGEWPNGKAVIW